MRRRHGGRSARGPFPVRLRVPSGPSDDYRLAPAATWTSRLHSGEGPAAPSAAFRLSSATRLARGLASGEPRSRRRARMLADSVGGQGRGRTFEGAVDTPGSAGREVIPIRAQVRPGAYRRPRPSCRQLWYWPGGFALGCQHPSTSRRDGAAVAARQRSVTVPNFQFC